MNKLCLIILIIFFSNYASGKSNVTELLYKLRHARNDTELLQSYKQVITYYADLDPDSEKLYLSEAERYFTKQNYLIGKADVLAIAGICDQSHGRIAQAKNHTDEALSIFRQQHNLKGVAETLHNLGAEEAGKGNFEAAIHYFINALKVYDSVTDDEGLITTYMNMGSLCSVHGDTADAWKYMMDAYSISKKTPPSEATIFLNNAIAVMYAGKGNKDTALKIFLKNLEVSDQERFAGPHAECLLYLGDFYEDKLDCSTALAYLNKGLEITKKHSFLEMESNFLFDIAQIKELTNADSAISYLNEAKVISQNIENKSYLVSIYGELAIAYRKQDNYKDALTATEARQKLADSLFSIDRNKELENINARYELEKNARIKQLETLNRQNTDKRNAIILVMFIIVIILFILLLLYRKTIMLNRKLTIREKELEKLNTMKDKLFSVIGHDLRAPLAQVPAILDICEDPDTTQEEKDYMLSTLKDHSNASLETLDKLLLWGRALVKGIDLAPVKLDTKKLVKQNIDLKKTDAIQKKITVVDNTAPGISAYCDATHFDFIIRNLIANAIKFTNQNGTVEINADRSKKPGFIIFEVRDNGIGIESAMLGSIFNPLSSREGTAHEKGSGIGLMLCKEFALKNGGDIWVESTAGKGSTFYFSVKKAE